jgi:hypothetical protein
VALEEVLAQLKLLHNRIESIQMDMAANRRRVRVCAGNRRGIRMGDSSNEATN